MKKLVLLCALLNLVFVTKLSALTKAQVETKHQEEVAAVNAALSNLTKSLSTYVNKIETKNWLANLKQGIYTYPSLTALTQEEVDALLQAINDIKSGTALRNNQLDRRYATNLKRKISPDLVAIVENIIQQTNYINNQVGFKRNEVVWFKRETWKPILQNFFTRVEALIQTFGQSPAAKAPTKAIKKAFLAPAERTLSHYFPKLKSGELVQKC